MTITGGGEILYYDVILSASDEELVLSAVRTVISGALIAAILYFRTMKSYKDELSVDEQTIFIIGVAFLILGGGSIVCLYNELGGVKDALAKGVSIRSYADKTEYLSPLGSMLKTLSASVKASFFCFLTLFINKKNMRTLAMLLLAIIPTTLYLMFDAGRSGMVFVICIVVFGFSRIKQINIIKPATAIVVLVGVLSKPMKYIMYNLTNLSFQNMLAFISSEKMKNYHFLYEFVYPFSNLLSVDEMNDKYGYRYFIDYVSWIPELFPQRLLQTIGVDIKGVELITREVTKYYVDMGRAARTPVDFLTLGLRQMPVVGLVVNVILFALLGRVMIWLSDALHRNYSFLLWFLYIFMFDLMISNDLGAMVKTKIGEIVVLIMLVWIAARRSHATVVDS